RSDRDWSSDVCSSDLQTEANFHQAQANVDKAKADLVAMRSKLEQTKRDWDRVQKLAPTKALSDLDVDTAKNAWETAQAAVPGGRSEERRVGKGGGWGG